LLGPTPCADDCEGEAQGDEEAADLAAEGPEAAHGDDGGEPEGRPVDQASAERWLDLALARGYVLKVQADGWKLFCDRMNLPAFTTWEPLRGFKRLRRALHLAERAAFVPEGMVSWANRTRATRSASTSTEKSRKNRRYVQKTWHYVFRQMGCRCENPGDFAVSARSSEE
jgi:hypothetical protein